MNPSELAFGLTIVGSLVALAAFFFWRQVVTLRGLANSPLSRLEQAYLRTRAWRRLVGSVLMLVLAGFLVGSYFLDREYRQVTAQVEERTEGDQKPLLKPEEKAFVRRFTLYWVATLLVLLGFVLLAAVDVWATLRFGWQQHRQLQQDHRVALEQQLRQVRQERNGTH